MSPTGDNPGDPPAIGGTDAHFRLLVESIEDYAIFLLDPSGVVRSWNNGARRIKGYQAHEIIGQHFSRFYSPADVASGKCDQGLAAALREGRFEDHGWRTRKDGTQFWASVVITTLRDPQGRHVGFAKITRDLTERAYRAFVEATNAIVWSTDADGRPNADSPSWRAFTGQSVEEWRGLRGWEPVHPEDRPRLQIEWPAAKQESRRFEAEFRLRRHDGAYVWMGARAIPFLTAAGAVREWFGVTFDISARKQAEAERAVALAEAELASRAKDEFLATVSHELRNPLNAILGWTKILAGKPLPDDVRRHLATIERNAHSQARLIDDVLDVSRVISGKLHLDMNPTDVGHAVADALEAVRPAAERKRLTLTAAVAPGTVIVADQVRLQQIVSNLLSNAVKFTPEGGRVTLNAALAGSTLRLTVEDSGEGIEPALLNAIFEPFRQADASTTRRHGGLGLGLAIVRQLATAHGGTVRAESEGRGRGARFTVELPLRAGGAQGGATTRDGRDEGSKPDLSGIRVLAVDDQADALELLRESLAAAGATVEAASSAEEAWDRFPRFRPHVLVTDLAMPDVDGGALIRRIRALPAAAGGATPALAVTAYSRREDVAAAIAAGFQIHVGKPVDPTRLATIVAQLVGARRGGA